MVVLVGARKSASASAASGRAHRTLCVVAPSAPQSPSRHGRGQPRAPYLEARRLHQRGNEIADSLPSGSGNLDVQLALQRQPFTASAAYAQAELALGHIFVPGNSRSRATANGQIRCSKLSSLSRLFEAFSGPNFFKIRNIRNVRYPSNLEILHSPFGRLGSHPILAAH
jgi:hypothetical protein